MSSEELSEVKLLIIDEIHLLGDVDRGPVLEFIVARMKIHNVRILGLSATIPNSDEIGRFLNAQVYVFGPEYRPVQLEQRYLGIKRAVRVGRRPEVFNEAVFHEAVLEPAGQYSVLVFVHSRRDTFLTGKFLVDKAVKDGVIGDVLGDIASREIIKSELSRFQAMSIENTTLLPYGIGVHHAGLKADERRLVESLFSDGHIKVLVSTLTLAVGVNLPSRKVIIKGTEVLGVSEGGSARTTLSAMDMLQMLGRAGRPQFDTQGIGVVITKKEDLGKIMALANCQVDIQSGIDGERLAEGLNAEIARGAVICTQDAIDWMKRLFYWIKLGEDQACLVDFHLIIHQVLVYLESRLLIQKTAHGNYKSTYRGKIISNFYLRFPTYTTFANNLRLDGIDESRLLEIFAQADEFSSVRTRPEEIPELDRLSHLLPIPIRPADDSDLARQIFKVSLVVQCHIARRLKGISDHILVTSTAGRLLRALVELAVDREWAEPAKVALRLAKATEAQMWPVGESVLRQLKGGMEIAKRVEKRGLTLNDMANMDAESLGIAMKAGKLGSVILKMVNSIPKVAVSVALQPLGRSMLQVEAEIEGKWNKGTWKNELFWVWVED
ncbi:nucleoside-triphosphatase, partial [Perkinsus sp. BL_2016]